ncbi:MAG: response regulator transcription factor [Pseudazoarcus pumilus]|nr:response regulator transcription factor [Pseudazoarcus pumilus]
MTRVLIVEDHALVREAMAQTLNRLEAGLLCVEARGSEEALELLAASAEWDLAVIDLMLPDMSGFSLLGVLAKRYPDMPTIVVSALDDQATLRRAMKVGASGFVSKSSSGDELRLAVRTVLDGGVFFMPQEAPEEVRRGSRSLEQRYRLTTAQTRVAELLGQGKTNREIADLLGLSEGTVKVHMSAIFRAMNVRNRAQALVALSRSTVRA